MEADAYCHDHRCDAACHPDLRILIRCHSIHWDPNFISESTALGRATLLRNEVLSFVNPAATTRSLQYTNSGLKSCLKSSNWMQQKPRVTFLPFCEVIDQYYPPLLQPHDDEGLHDANEPAFNDEGFDDSSLMARVPRLVSPQSDSSAADSDFDEHVPTSPSSFPEHHAWQSAHVYDLKSNYGRGRVHTNPPEATFTDIRRLLGYRFHDVANIYDINPAPADLRAANVAPFLLLAHDDVRFGDNRRAILVDVELHGPNWDSTIEIDRYTTMIPTPIHRSLMLKIAGVLRYCTTMKNKCLLWHRGFLIPAKSNSNLDLHHGDYVRIALPPFQHEQVPTYYDELFTDIEAAQQPAASDDHALLQSSCTILHWPPILQGRSSWHVQPDKTFHNFEECQAPEIEVSRHDRVPQQRHANHEVGTTPAWRTSLEHEFTARAEVANDEEGPIAFVTTWYLQGPLEQLSEESRPLRLDQFTRHWKRDLEELWQDRILRTVPLHIVHVQPEPPQHDRSWTIGHVILYRVSILHWYLS